MKKSAYTRLYSFSGGTDGNRPYGGVIAAAGALYGMTQLGGAHDLGTVYSVTTSGSERIVYSFRGGLDGADPFEDGLAYVNGTVYGTTLYGGGSTQCGGDGCGTVFKLSASGKENVLHAFGSGTGDGEIPLAGVVVVKGTVYGTTAQGGTAGNGTVFSVSPSGKYHVLYSFTGGGDGGFPEADLLDIDGTLYGTTERGGSDNYGTIFSITPAGTEHTLHSFTFSEGTGTQSNLIDVNGVLYGTAYEGGGGGCPQGCGTVFGYDIASGTVKVLYTFQGSDDGSFPIAGLIYANGTFYGTTSTGGTGKTSCSCGTIFKLSAKGKETQLYRFSEEAPAGGEAPYGGVTLLDGVLYGSGVSGGSADDGVVFSLSL